MIKWKLFQDVEAKVIGCDIDKNNEGVLQCVLQNGITFKAKMKGTHEERLYENQLNNVGKFVNIKFQQYTVDGVPQFPVSCDLYVADVSKSPKISPEVVSCNGKR